VQTSDSTMLKFFRSIRKKLIEEDNVRKYILYAIGEILLVVIGILIALQVNNWNEQRKLNTEIETFQKALLSELQNDLTSIDQKIEIIRMNMKRDSALYNRVTGPDATLDTLVQIGRYEYDIWINPMVNFNDNTLNSLESSGLLPLLDGQIRTGILDLTNQKELYKNQLETNIEYFLDALNNYRSKYRLDSNEGGSPISDQLWEQASPDLYALMTSVMTAQNVTNGNSLGFLRSIRKKINRLNQELEK